MTDKIIPASDYSPGLPGPLYQYSQPISYSFAASGQQIVQSPFGIDSEACVLSATSTNTNNKAHIIADNSNSNITTPQNLGLPGITFFGANAFSFTEYWFPVKENLAINILTISSGTMIFVIGWRIRTDIKLPTERHTFSDPSF